MSMSGFMKKHSDLMLGFIALIFLAIIVWYVGWGVQAFTADIQKAFSLSSNASSSTLFDLQGAAALDLRGLAKSP